jgi:hypothetical protein
MNLYLISQTENDCYDTYDSAVICAASAEEAQKVHPAIHHESPDLDPWTSRFYSDRWASSPAAVTVKLLGTADPTIPAGVVLTSFNAG